MNDSGSKFRGGRDRRTRNPGSGLTVSMAEKILLRAVRDARRRLLRSGNQFDINVAGELEKAALAWTDLTGLAFPSDEALDKKDESNGG